MFTMWCTKLTTDWSVWSKRDGQDVFGILFMKGILSCSKRGSHCISVNLITSENDLLSSNEGDTASFHVTSRRSFVGRGSTVENLIIMEYRHSICRGTTRSCRIFLHSPLPAILIAFVVIAPYINRSCPWICKSISLTSWIIKLTLLAAYVVQWQ